MKTKLRTFQLFHPWKGSLARPLSRARQLLNRLQTNSCAVMCAMLHVPHLSDCCGCSVSIAAEVPGSAPQLNSTTVTCKLQPAFQVLYLHLL